MDFEKENFTNNDSSKKVETKKEENLEQKPEEPPEDKQAEGREETEKEIAKKDREEIEKIRASLGIEVGAEDEDPEKVLEEILGLKGNDIERAKILKAKSLPENYQKQVEFFNNKSLEGVNIAVIPDDLWIKGQQPTESIAEKNLILIKESYFQEEETENQNAWIAHELAHCENFLNSDSEEEYHNKMKQEAFGDLDSEFTYPNNLVEEETFTKQFQYLKGEGKNKDDIWKMVKDYYEEEDYPFFEKIVEKVYK